MSVYNTKVIGIGEEAETFIREKMVILFGEDVPTDLSIYSYKINTVPLKGNIEKDMVLSIDDEKFIITAVGDVVEKNLNDLGHITLNFNGSNIAEVQGTLYLEDKKIPDIKVSSVISIY